MQSDFLKNSSLPNDDDLKSYYHKFSVRKVCIFQGFDIINLLERQQKVLNEGIHFDFYNRNNFLK